MILTLNENIVFKWTYKWPRYLCVSYISLDVLMIAVAIDLKVNLIFPILKKTVDRGVCPLVYSYVTSKGE